MTRATKAVSILLLLALAAGFVVWAVYATFMGGTTSGPDFLQAVKSGSVSTGSISSIEVVEPAVGHTPFATGEYDSLPRVKKLSGGASISRLVTLLESAQPGRIHQNHPVTTYHVYLKANCQDGFFWLYGDVLQDAQGAVLVLSANTRNAVNPNGASTYHLDDFAEVLTMVQKDKNTEPNGAANGSQPIRSETNSTSSAAGSRR
jgi:hypothetical protein